MNVEPSTLPAEWTIPDTLRRRLRAAPGRQRLLDEDGHLLLWLANLATPIAKLISYSAE